MPEAVKTDHKIDLREPGMTPRRLRYTFGAIERFEELHGGTFNSVAILLRSSGVSMKALRLLLYAGLEAGGTKREGEMLTPFMVREKIEAYLEAGGFLQDITDAVIVALNRSIVLRPKPTTAVENASPEAPAKPAKRAAGSAT